MKNRLLLGSQSPRRKEILSFFNIPFIQVASHFDEESLPFEGDPVSYTTKLSLAKALSLQKTFPDEVILTADTVVYLEGKVYNKPSSAKEAHQFLKELGGKWHHVHTAVHLVYKEKIFTEGETTKLLFYRLTDQQIEAFHKHIYFLDKAGGYAIEKCGQLILEKMEGCYYNVLGLPINPTYRLLKHVGIDLWDHLREVL